MAVFKEKPPVRLHGPESAFRVRMCWYGKCSIGCIVDFVVFFQTLDLKVLVSS